MSGLALLLAAGVSIYALRASFILGAHRMELPDPVRNALSHAPAAVLGALLATVLAPGAAVAPDGRAVVVALVALVVSRRYGMTSTIAAGFATLVVLGSL